MRGATYAALALTLVVAGCAYNPQVARPIALNAEAQSSKIFAADGTMITTLHAEENRENVPLDGIARPLRDAVVAIEDRRFWQHGGVDLRALLRAAWANTSKGGVVEGGSTITQQYVKNSLLDPQRTLHRKIKEASLAYQLERHYSKQQILEGYLNTIYFGNGAYGAQAAAGVYFATTADKLSLSQAALLAGLIRSPRSYDPYREPAAALARRNLVLDEMVGLGWATPEEAARAKAAPIGVNAQPTQSRYPAAYFVEEVKQAVLDDPAFGKTPAERQAALFTGGLRIYTTVDLKMQAEAEDAVAKVLSQPATDPEAAVVTVEPTTGYVRALVGGRDFFGAGPHAKFDLAAQGGRPAGSSFKPLVLAAALQEGVPLSRVYAAPSRITLALPGPQPAWEVRNYEDQGGGRMNLLEATVHSINTVYAQLVLDVGPAQAIGVARRMGVRSPLQPYPSAVLGTNDVTPLDMATAYATLANRGVRVDPVLITRVTKADGTVLYEHQRTTVRAIPRNVADTVTDVLQQVVLRGTGIKANIGRPVAGKTGTGEQWRDAWFVGYTPELVTSVWVGFPQAQISMVPPATRVLVTGGTWPAQIWQLYMTAALAETPATAFAAPDADPSTTTARTEPGAPSAPDVSVPNVVGMPFSLAAERLRAAGFAPVEHDVPNGDYSPGFVVGQRPGPSSLAPAGSRVTLDVSTGTAAVAEVPDVLGLTAAQARAAIEQAGFATQIVVESEPPSPGADSRAGRVWRQSPAGGSRRQAGDVVTVSVNPG